MALVGPMPGSCINRLQRSSSSGYFGDGLVVFVDALIQPVGVGEHVADAAVGPARQVFEVWADFSPQAFDLLREDDAEFGNQSAQAVVECGAFFDESLPGAVQGEGGLAVVRP